MDLQGLRALAVGLVVLNHAFDWPAGGFVGVDIFFVISGFLMTSLIYREYERTGRIAFLAFYRRRVRRLIPASATVIVATLIGAWALFSSGRLMSTVWDGVASLFFVSNWRFAAEAADYFAQGARTSPLQHYWSLSLEEQYYLVWPLAVLVLALLVARARRPRATAALVSMAITVALFLLSLQLTQSDSVSAYFITPARLWELSVGATIAFCMPHFDRLPAASRSVLMLVSLTGMLTAAFITPSNQGFPAPWALVAVLSTAMFIAFPWHPKRRTWLNPLDNSVLSHLGDISYSLYLWHFPALILITEAFRGLPGDKSPVPAVVSIVVTLIVAELSFRFIEEPVRRSRWLEPKPKRRAGSRLPKLQALAIVVCAVAAVVAVTVAFAVDRQARGGGNGGDGSSQTSPTPGGAVEPGSGKDALSTIQGELSTALAAKEWPETDPSLDSVVSGYSRDEATNACSNQVYPGVEKCTWGAADAPVSLAIVGDSTSVAYVPLLRALVDASNGQLKVTAMGMYGCPFVDFETTNGLDSFNRACPGRKEEALENIAALKPSVVLISNTYISLRKADGGQPFTPNDYAHGLTPYLERIAPNTGKIVLLAAPPADKDIRECYSPRTAPSACVSTVPSRWKAIGATESSLATTFKGAWIDTRPLFCVATSCPAFAAGLPTKFDQLHLTEEYARYVAPGMAELLGEKGVSLTSASASNAPPAPEPTDSEGSGTGAASAVGRLRPAVG